MSEMLARLNPKTCRLDIGTGSVGGLSDQDIAAALGMVKNRLGADILCYLHAPGAINAAEFEVSLLQRVRLECHRRTEEVVNAEIRLLMRGGNTGSLRDLHRVTAGRAGLWPQFDSGNFPRYCRLVVSVLDEVRSGPVCKTCNGRMRLVTTEGSVECPSCGGTGKTEESQRRRAARLGLTQPPFQRQWDAPYRWLLGEVQTAMVEANDQFRRALGRRVSA